MIHDDLEIVFASIHDQVLPNADFPIKIDAIANCIKGNKIVDRIEYIASEDLSQVQGVLRKVYVPSSDMRIGRIYHQPDKGEPGANYCWERFTKAKELSHLIIDEPEQSAYDEITIREIAAWAANQRSGPTFENRKAVESEIWGEVAALEILFPISWRQGLIIARHREMYTFTHHGIAERFRIPEIYAASALGVETHTRLLRAAVRNNPQRFEYLQTPWEEFLAER